MSEQPTNVAPNNDNNDAQKPAKKESLLLNLLLNIVVPTLILSKLSGDEYLGTKLAVVVALAFPIIYGIMDFRREHKVNIFSVLGFISVLLTGGISLLELPPSYIAIKEAAIPGLIGIATLISIYTRYPLVKVLVYNDKLIDTDKVHAALSASNNHAAFERVLKVVSYIVAGSFFLSSVLNYILAKWIVVAPPNTVEYNEQLGKMMALSYPVIALPATVVLIAALFYLFRQITKLTQLQLEDIMRAQ